jgi:ABC-type Fe3+/spermidine/putrescine transport system ATPase subunit
VTLQIRAEHVKLAFEKPIDSTNCFKGLVERSVYEGSYVIYQVRLDDGPTIIAREQASRRPLADRGSAVWVVLASDDCVLLN